MWQRCFCESSLFSIVDMIWEYSINQHETIHTLKSTSVLNLCQISLKLTARLQNHEQINTDCQPPVLPVLSVCSHGSNKQRTELVSWRNAFSRARLKLAFCNFALTQLLAPRTPKVSTRFIWNLNDIKNNMSHMYMPNIIVINPMQHIDLCVWKKQP